jgi:hypothetical protein
VSLLQTPINELMLFTEIAAAFILRIIRNILWRQDAQFLLNNNAGGTYTNCAVRLADRSRLSLRVCSACEPLMNDSRTNAVHVMPQNSEEGLYINYLTFNLPPKIKWPLKLTKLNQTRAA